MTLRVFARACAKTAPPFFAYPGPPQPTRQNMPYTPTMNTKYQLPTSHPGTPLAPVADARSQPPLPLATLSRALLPLGDLCTLCVRHSQLHFYHHAVRIFPQTRPFRSQKVALGSPFAGPAGTAPIYNKPVAIIPGFC